jgi:acetyl esterase
MGFFDAAYGADRSDPRGFPILGDHSNAPPTIVVTASLDPIRDSGRAYAKALVDAGRDCVFLEMRGVTHSFTNLRGMVPSTQADLERIIAAMRFMLANPA